MSKLNPITLYEHLLRKKTPIESSLTHSSSPPSYTKEDHILHYNPRSTTQLF